MLLACDVSSTNIGWCVLTDDGAVTAQGTIRLRGKTIQQRIREAFQELGWVFQRNHFTRVALEGPAYKTAPQAMIAQQRVAGALLHLAEAMGRGEVIEIAPTSAKKALTGSGRADKEQMQRMAEPYLGESYTEHEADALAVGLAALGELRLQQLVQ